MNACPCVSERSFAFRCGTDGGQPAGRRPAKPLVRSAPRLFSDSAGRVLISRRRWGQRASPAIGATIAALCPVIKRLRPVTKATRPEDSRFLRPHDPTNAIGPRSNTFQGSFLDSENGPLERCFPTFFTRGTFAGTRKPYGTLIVLFHNINFLYTQEKNHYYIIKSAKKTRGKFVIVSVEY